MHEFSMAAALVEQILEFAAARQIQQVVQVRLAVGELTLLEPEQMRFCYSSIVKETAAEGSTLEFETIRARVRCPGCAYEGAPKYWDDALWQAPVPTLQCPTCGQAAEAIEGHECAIKSIKYAN